MTHIDFCNCGAYPIPHPLGIGQCQVETSDRPVCSSCGENCALAAEDFGIGPYEAWGRKGVDTNIQTVSQCCSAEPINASTGKSWEDKS